MWKQHWELGSCLGYTRMLKILTAIPVKVALFSTNERSRRDEEKTVATINSSSEDRVV
jgi:transcriptional regulator of met regulon